MGTKGECAVLEAKLVGKVEGSFVHTGYFAFPFEFGQASVVPVDHRSLSMRTVFTWGTSKAPGYNVKK